MKGGFEIDNVIVYIHPHTHITGLKELSLSDTEIDFVLTQCHDQTQNELCLYLFIHRILIYSSTGSFT